MKLYLPLAFLLITGTSQKCKKDIDSSNKIPVCIQQKIDSIKAQPKWNPPATVYEYLYKGKKVFGFSADCCDQYNPVFDENCNYLCAPTGGISGGGDRSCRDFSQEAKEVRLVWKDER